MAERNDFWYRLGYTLERAAHGPVEPRGRLASLNERESEPRAGGALAFLGKDPAELALDFVGRSESQHRRLVEMMFSSPQAWSGRHGRTMGAPEHLGRILRSLTSIFARERRLRRMAPRFRCQLAASSRTADGQGLSLTVMDISERGASLRLPAQAMVPSPENFRLRIAWNETEVTTLNARIRNVRRGTGGSRLLGVLFTDLTREQQQDLRKHLYAPPSQDKSLAPSRS